MLRISELTYILCLQGQICSGNGKCKGEGTRKGNGKCACDTGYGGDTCNR